jgi:hypothetical protein
MREIKIRELSIGDWVRYDFPEIGKRNIQVNSIDEEDNHIGAGGIGASAWSDVSEFEPIPLTPEILEKNGFVDYEVGKGWYVLNVADDLRVWLHRNSHDWTFQLMEWSPLSTHEIGKVFINHTHQLQHALRLAGVEKGIEV